MALLITVPSASGVVVSPTSIETLSSSDLHLTIHNPTQSYLINVTVILPLSLTPVGLDTDSGRWNTIATAGRDSFRVQWLGAVAAGGTVVLGLAVDPKGGPRLLNLTIHETYDNGARSNSTQSISLVCPCLLGIDVRYLAYGTVGLVLLLPALEVLLLRAKVLRRQDN